MTEEEIPQEVFDTLDKLFPKGDERRGDALVVNATALIAGKDINRKEANGDIKKVYVVGEAGCEHDMMLGIYLDKDKALKASQEHRLSLLEDAKHGNEFSIQQAKEYIAKGVWFDGRPIEQESIDHFKKEIAEGNDMYLEMIKKLSEEDPKKIDNYPHDTPYLREEEVII